MLQTEPRKLVWKKLVFIQILGESLTKNTETTAKMKNSEDMIALAASSSEEDAFADAILKSTHCQNVQLTDRPPSGRHQN